MSNRSSKVAENLLPRLVQSSVKASTAGSESGRYCKAIRGTSWSSVKTVLKRQHHSWRRYIVTDGDRKERQ
jgi:hypothetical protein